MQKENPDIAGWKHLAEQSLGWGDSRNWNDYDFEKLSDRIFDKTNVRLSLSTLKRIWGKVRYESSPNTATLNALARFLEFADWRDFQQKYPAPSPSPAGPSTTTAAPSTTPATTSPPAAPKRLRAPVIILAVVIIITMSLIFLSPTPTTTPGTSAPAPRTAAPVKFESRKVSDDLPNSVVFEYDASAFHSDSVYIQQNWDPTRREKVPGDGHFHTSIYYRPGFFRAKLIVDGQVKKESDIFIKTRGWVGIIGTKPAPIYLKLYEMMQQGALGINSGTLIRKTGSAVFQDQWTTFSNVREFEGLDSSDFTMVVTLRNTSSMEQSPCRKINIYILGTESAIGIPLSAKGCISELELLTGDHLLSGKENDLSAFGCDIHSFQHLSCRVKDGHLKIYLNDQQIFDTIQKATIGAIIGIRIGFEGAGEFKDLQLVSHGKDIDLTSSATFVN